MWNRMTPEGVLVTAQSKLDDFRRLFPNKNMPETLTEAQTKELVKLSKDALAATDPTEKLYRAALVDMGMNTMVSPSDGWTKARTVRIIAMLANPKTIIRNIGGNQFLFFANTASEYLDAPVDIGTSFLRRGWTGDGPLSGRAYRSTTVPSLKAKAEGFMEPGKELAHGFKMNFPDKVDGGWRAQLKAQKQALDGALEYTAVLGKLTSQNKFEMQAVKDINKWVFDSNTGQAIEKFLSIGLGVPDRAFWWSAVRGSMDKQMRLHTLKTGEKLASPTPKMVEEAYLDGTKAIFQDENAFSRFAHNARKFLNFNPFWLKDRKGSATFKFGLGDVVLPFAQVPATLAARGLEYSPAGYAKALYQILDTIPYGQMSGREFNQKAFVEAFSRATAGTIGTVGGGYFLASQGIINSTLDEDPDIRDYQKSMGVNAYRINVSALKRKLITGFTTTVAGAIEDPDKLLELLGKDEGQDGDIVLSYDWAQPLSLSLAMGAELFNQEVQKARGQDVTAKEHIYNFVDALKAGTKTFTELSFLQSLNSFHQATANYGLWEGIKQTTLRDLPSSFIPTFLNQFEQLRSNVVRDATGPDEFENSYLKIASRIPFVLEKAGYPAKRDVYGEVVRRFPNVEQHIWYNVFFNPALVSTLVKNDDPVTKELFRLYDVTGEKRQFPRKSPRRLTVNGEKVTLTPDQRSAYQQFTGRLTRDVFRYLITTPKFIKKSDKGKAIVMGNWISAISTAAKVQLLGQDSTTLKGKPKALLAIDMSEDKAKRGTLIDLEEPKE